MARKWRKFPSYAKSLGQKEDADETDGFALLTGPETDKKKRKTKKMYKNYQNFSVVGNTP